MDTIVLVILALAALVFVSMVVIFFWTFFTAKRNKYEIGVIWRTFIEHRDSSENARTRFQLYIALADIVSTLHEAERMGSGPEEPYIHIGVSLADRWEKTLRSELRRIQP